MATSQDVELAGDGADDEPAVTVSRPARKRKPSIQFRFDDATLQVIGELTEAIGQTNRTELVSKALLFVHYLLGETEKGADVCLKQPNGDLEKLPLKLLLY